MTIKPAKIVELKAIRNILDEGRCIMRESGNREQWANGYPDEADIFADITQRQGFVCMVDQAIVGYFCFMMGQDPDPNYQAIQNGAWLNDKPYGVLHRLASGRLVRGVARAVFDFAFSYIDNVKVDTHRDNLPVQNFLKKYGFSYCGIIHLRDGSPRDAFQKYIQ